MDTCETIKKEGRIELVHQCLKKHPLDDTKRDIFEKKIGFAHRDENMKGDEPMSTYFYFSSMDSDESKTYCPEKEGTSRTFIYFGMHKFEYITRKVKQEQDDME